MLVSFALLFLLGLFFGWLAQKCKLPSLVGYLLTGIVLGPYVLNLLSDDLLALSPVLRQIALVVILIRAGLSLNLADLKAVGRSAALMCFVPACFEIVGICLLAPPLLGLNLMESALLGCVLAAVSPAVIVPRMISLLQQKIGTDKKIPQMILAGASVDDVFVIVLFSVFLSLNMGQSVGGLGAFFSVPISAILGAGVGLLCGLAVAAVFGLVHLRDSAKLLIVLGLAFLLVSLEEALKASLPFSGLLAVMGMGAGLLIFRPPVARRLSEKFSKLWVAAEVWLFVLVGASVNLSYTYRAGLLPIVVMVGALVFRSVGVLCCLVKTGYTPKEKLFCAIAYLPKATVQAAIGATPLAMGLSNGNMILTMAVLAILITAPVGAFLIDFTHKKLLCK